MTVNVGGSDRNTSHDHAISLDVALDFVNTLEYEDGQPVDHLQTTRDALEWLQIHELCHGSPPDVPQTLQRIRQARTALRELVDAAADHRLPTADSVAHVNSMLRAREILELVCEGDEVALTHRHVGDPLDDALAQLAEPIARAVSGDRPDRFRVCANDLCRWAFYDTSRTGSRRWCDMATCGNRAKAARHRQRTKLANTEPQARIASA